jgi:hypothetical protein
MLYFFDLTHEPQQKSSTETSQNSSSQSHSIAAPSTHSTHTSAGKVSFTSFATSRKTTATSSAPSAVQSNTVVRAPCVGIAVEEGIICVKWQPKTNQLACR